MTNMSDAYMLRLFADLRSQILEVVVSAEGQLHRIPNGFRNHLYWQIGHVLTVTDELIYGLTGEGSRIPPVYRKYFAPGTVPVQGQEQLPPAEVLIKQLQQQQLDISEMDASRMEQPVPDSDNFLHASKTRELFYVLIAHEGTHVGMIHAMVKVLARSH